MEPGLPKGILVGLAIMLPVWTLVIWLACWALA